MVSTAVENIFARPSHTEWHQLVKICATVDHGFLVNSDALAVFAAFEYLVQCRSVSGTSVSWGAEVSKTGAAGAGSGLQEQGQPQRLALQAQLVLVVLLF